MDSELNPSVLHWTCLWRVKALTARAQCLSWILYDFVVGLILFGWVDAIDGTGWISKRNWDIWHQRRYACVVLQCILGSLGSLRLRLVQAATQQYGWLSSPRPTPVASPRAGSSRAAAPAAPAAPASSSASRMRRLWGKQPPPAGEM